MGFYGREDYKKRIQKALGSEGHTVLLIYGRRRVGKSELIKQCLRESGLDGIYYECKQTNEMNNTQSLAALISDSYGIPRLAFSGIEELLDFLFKRSTEEELVLALDEYPYLRASVRGLDSILQSLIDKYRDSARLKLILCGSFVDVMKSLVMEENPLYGRFDLVIDLKPMDYYESANFYPGFSDEDKVRLFSVFGGIPYYNRLVDPKRSVRENIIELIASVGARLENEVAMYLRTEVSKLSNANEVFEALAGGFSKYNDILSQSHVSSGPTMVDVLDKLIRMEVVERRVPINEKNNRRRAGYYISDNLSLFYYRYIFRYASQMNVMDPDVFYERYIEEDFEEKYVPMAFETICRQYLVRMNRGGHLPKTFDEIGKYYYDDPVNKTNGEFDIVTVDPAGYIFYEAKFRKKPISASMIEDEIRQVKAAGLSCYKYGFFSRSGFEGKPGDDMIFIDLKRVYHHEELLLESKY